MADSTFPTFHSKPLAVGVRQRTSNDRHTELKAVTNLACNAGFSTAQG